MKTTAACTLLAAVSWLVFVLRHHEAALVFAVVWTAMAVAYGCREWRTRAGA